ncbi:G-type lectin S-receptor-like serine/threonine-protein kinase [Dichanthelium oligosanthes]|uniref:Receptor-like serine/threonine-protein kinase n=1 Tax=Dichanthelium oligosanthes TaxID=888268 RepID=A0A1E5WKD8_9POAL|nr:G-type lectin S-receptor-like serine/threonine-protein kinase [Dichanthelium oligosanthes]
MSSIFWSSQANITRNNTTAVLLNSGNFILRDASDLSDILWQSFDHPTDTFLAGSKLGWDKLTGLNRRLVSKKNSRSPATGVYSMELDPSGVPQIVLTRFNSSVPSYWSSGVWNGQYFSSVPEVSRYSGNQSFVNNDHEKYYTYTYTFTYETLILYFTLDVSGQIKTFIWLEGSQDWELTFTQPRAQCDVYAACGPFTICKDDALPYCSCMEGFTIRSPEDWDLGDRTGGCLRKTPLDCIVNGSVTSSTDKFYSIPCASLSNDGRCSIWHEELLNIRQTLYTTNLNGETLYLRLAAEDVQSLEETRRGVFFGVAIGTSVAALCSFALIILILIWRNKRKSSDRIFSYAQGCNGIIAFRYTDLKRATKNFSEKLGEGGFGLVFKGFLNDSTAIAVKRLDRAYQREKQFRAEVSSIGIIQHINLVKLIGFCCEGSRRLLVYEHMANGSLDIHLFQSHAAVLKWCTRYQIALGVARGLAYLHENCRDCIIHCDIKPENILIDDLFAPKIADFGMAKFLGRDFTRILTTMRGTIGYLAPEWIGGAAITPKVDVYAYGMVLLEILSGKRNSCVSCSCGSNHDVYYPVHVAREILEGDVRSLLDNRLCGEVNLKEAEIACKVLDPSYNTEDGNTCEFTQLRIVDIASNNFSGTLPIGWFKMLKSMATRFDNETSVMENRYYHGQTYQFTAAITYKGNYMTFSKILRALVLIDILNNALYGTIPEAMGTLCCFTGSTSLIMLSEGQFQLNLAT